MIVGKPLFNVEQIQEKVKELGARISNDYQGKKLVVVSILRGAFIFTADLVRYIKVPLVLDFLVATSYMHENTTGEVDIHCDIRVDIHGKDVLIVEDIIDTGITLNYVREMFMQREPRSIKICGLLDKRERRVVDVPVDYIGFQIPNKFVVGYGLDYDNKFRNLPYIAIFKKES